MIIFRALVRVKVRLGDMASARFKVKVKIKIRVRVSVGIW
jgi:hypothetical protein